jgi:imidazolonepropionase-like amidohydrolase
MRKSLALPLIILLPILFGVQVNQAAPSQLLVFNHVTVIDMTGAPPQADMTVVIQGTRIIAIGRSSKIRIARAARVIDATGKYLIPGLWDMHTHLGDDEFDRNSYLRLFIANGVTGIRIMDGAPEHHLWRREVESGMLLGPRMLIASRAIGFSDLSNISPRQVRREVRKAQQEGADFIKVHDNVLRESYVALLDEAKRFGLPVEGHVPASITAEAASNAGQKSVEHFTGLDEAKSDESKAEALSAVFRKNGTRLCPTLIMRSNYASLDDASLANDPRLRYVKPAWRKRWLSMTKEAVNTPPGEWSKRKELIRKEKALVGKMQKAGVRILAGTDDGNPYSIPGFSLHDELAMLVEAGLTPMQALQAATYNAAKFFDKLDSMGTVEKGRLADLILLDADPLENINNTARINAVVVNGRYFPKGALQNVLAEVEAASDKK